MAEDVVNNAAFASKLPKKDCVTRNLAIGNNAIKKGADFLQETYTYDEKDIAHFVQNEMAITVEDVLSRRTRLLLLDAKAAIAAAPAVAKIMAELLNKDAQWIDEQVAAFSELAGNYSLKPLNKL